MTSAKKCQKTDTSSTSYQCYYSEDGAIPKCERVNVDEYCEIDESSKQCKNKIELEENNKCQMNNEGTECKSVPFDCYDYDPSKCIVHGNTCFKVNGNPKCQIVEVDGKCEIDDNGDCAKKEDGGLQDYEKCVYLNGYSECKPVNKTCSEMASDKCNQCKATTSGFTCLKVINSCKEIEIDNSLCKINDDGECVKVSDTTDNNLCQFENYNTRCHFYEVNSQCTLTSETPESCSNGASFENSDNKKCDLVIKSNYKTACEPRDKKCDEYDSTRCEGIKSKTKKCSMSDNTCQEYSIDNYCTVDAGKCKKALDDIGEKYDCFFGINSDFNSCVRKEQICENYYENCDTHSNSTYQCVQINNFDYCKPIKIDDYCKIDLNFECNPSKTIKDNQICAYDDESEKKSWKIRDKVCGDYSSDPNACNSQEKCYHSGTYCCETEEDDFCFVQGEECKKRENKKLEEYEKCRIDRTSESQYKYRCEKARNCKVFTNSTSCNAVPVIDGETCYYKSGSCKILWIDDKCIMNSEGECVENGSGKLSSNEICFLEEDPYYLDCFAKEKECSDFEDDTCGNLTPEPKLCFNIGSDDNCREVKVDPQCSMNENDECTGNSCYLDKEEDEDYDRCHYKNNDNNDDNSDGSLLKMSQIILLILFSIL